MIAEFMGHTENKQNGVWNTFCPFEGEGHHIETMKYHWSWDWLMPVVEKIENLEYKNREGRFSVNSVNFEENYTAFVVDFDEGLIQVEGETKFEATYQAVFQFIEWHNEQTLNKA